MGPENKEKIVTRFAPSPTGFLHVGGIRTALYAWLWARKNNGEFILRIEDTDKGREVAGSLEHIKECLEWLGLKWDKFFIQSERLSVYKKWADKLLNIGCAYADGGAVRFKISQKKRYSWHDLVYGDLSAGEDALEDFVLMKSDGFPTYNFAHIVDDIEMGVTHVMRGEEFISSMPKFLAVYEALGVNPPKFVTLPVILASGGKKKLSKRDGAKDLLEYQKEGYLPDALLNFLALLGWNPGTEQEIFTRDELLQTFSLERIQKSGALLNTEKLNWINREHIKKVPISFAEKEILSRLPENMRNSKIIPVILERISKWSDASIMAQAGEIDFFFKAPVLDHKKLNFKKTSSEVTKKCLDSALKGLQNIEESNFNAENVKSTLMLLAEAAPEKGALLHPVRYALSGLERSPDPFIIAEILGKNETLVRLQKAI